jgi:hypothetical protein
MKGWVLVVWLGTVAVVAVVWGVGGYLAYRIIS